MQVRPSLSDILALVTATGETEVWVGFDRGSFVVGSGTNHPVVSVSFSFSGRKSVRKALDALEKKMVSLRTSVESLRGSQSLPKKDKNERELSESD